MKLPPDSASLCEVKTIPDAVRKSPEAAPRRRLAPPRYAQAFPWLLALLVAGLVWFGHELLFATFASYDDEGYVLMTLRSYLESGNLYGEVYSQYGPFYYVLIGGFFEATGAPITNSTARWLTLALWSASAAACALTVWESTGRRMLTLFTLAATFLYLWVMISEPLHPGNVIAFLIAGTAWATSRHLRAAQVTKAALLAGAAAAALLLIKINVGIFFLAAVAGCGLLAPGLRRRLPFSLMAAGFALLPFVLMRDGLQEGWVRTMAVLFAAAAIPLLDSVRRLPAANLGIRDAVVFFSGFLAVAVPVLALTLIRGSSLSDVLSGILIEPLRHPDIYSFPIAYPRGAWIAGLLSLGIYAVVLRLERQNPQRVLPLLGTIRLLLAVGFGLSWYGGTGWTAFRFVMIFVLPFCWAFLRPVPRTPDGAGAEHAKAWLLLLLLAQSLHAYPVAVSQLAWGTFLAVLLVAFGLTPVSSAPPTHRSPATGRRWALLHIAPALLLAAVLIHMVQIAGVRLRTLPRDRPLALPGAERINLPEHVTAAYRTLTANSALHAATLFSLPGMFSFNLWSGVPPPGHSNATHWFSLLGPSSQEAIIRQLDQDPQACLIVHLPLLDLLKERVAAARSPLAGYLDEHFSPAFRVYQYEFRVKKNRAVLPVQTAEIFYRTPASDAAHSARLLIRLALDTRQTLSGLEVLDLRAPDVPIRPALDSALVQITAIDSTGTRRAGSTEVVFPFAAHGLVELEILTNLGPDPLPAGTALVRILGDNPYILPVIH